MSNYLRNVAHRAAGASLLRPRVPSRFEPVAGMGPAIGAFREVMTERAAEAPRVTHTTETRVPPPPVLRQATEPQATREEGRATTLPAITHTAEERAVNRKKPEIDQPHPLRELRTQNDPASNTPTAVRSVRPEITQEPAETRVPNPRHVVAENVQPRQGPRRPIETADAGVAVPPAAQQSPALTPERREQPDRPDRHTPVTKTAPHVRTREFPIAPAPVPYAQPVVPQTEIAAPTIHVSIGKVTVQASLPAAPVHAPARTPAHGGPRLTLERYLDGRGGRR